MIPFLLYLKQLRVNKRRCVALLPKRRTLGRVQGNNFQMQEELFEKPKPVTLDVRGNVPSFKNCKRVIARTPKGVPLERPILITKPEVQERMEEITESFVLQLSSAWQTAEGKTLTGPSQRSLIASSVPDDDCWTRIPILHVSAVLDPGNEGVEITIERL